MSTTSTWQWRKGAEENTTRQMPENTHSREKQTQATISLSIDIGNVHILVHGGMIKVPLVDFVDHLL